MSSYVYRITPTILSYITLSHVVWLRGNITWYETLYLYALKGFENGVSTWRISKWLRVVHRLYKFLSAAVYLFRLKLKGHIWFIGRSLSGNSESCLFNLGTAHVYCYMKYSHLSRLLFKQNIKTYKHLCSILFRDILY